MQSIGPNVQTVGPIVQTIGPIVQMIGPDALNGQSFLIDWTDCAKPGHHKGGFALLFIYMFSACMLVHALSFTHALIHK